MEAPKVVSGEKLPRDFVFVSFEAAREGWNSYKLEDGSILKTRFVLINVIMEKNFKQKIEKARTEKGIGLGVGFSSNNVIGVEASIELRGEPSTKACSLDELRASVVKEDMDFDIIKETWNVYKLEEGIVMKARSSPITISRTSKFDSHGLPIYLVDFTADVKVSLPKK